jgi:hypothetical protein
LEPYVADTWITDWRNQAASAAPASWTTMYPGTLRHGKSRRRAKARLTAGLRWAPETLPMNRMIAITMRPGATTAAVRLMVSGKA